MRRRMSAVAGAMVGTAALGVLGGCGAGSPASTSDGVPAASTSDPGGDHSATLAERRAIVAVGRSFLTVGKGRPAASCALETPAYRAYDRAHGGWCSRISAHFLADAKKYGVTAGGSHVHVVYVEGHTAELSATVGIGHESGIDNYYVRHKGGKWWISGDGRAGDLGW